MQEKEIDLGRLFAVLLNNWWKIAISSLVGFILLFTVSKFFMTPMYQSYVTVYIDSANGSSNSAVSYNDIMVSQQLVNTYMQLMMSNSVMMDIADEVNLGYDFKDIRAMTSVSPLTDTELFVVTITNSNPEHSYIIANAIADRGTKSVMNLVETREVRIIDSAQMPLYPSSPNVKRNAFFGFMLGFLISSLIFILKDLFDVRIMTESDLEDILSVPIIGVIPAIE